MTKLLCNVLILLMAFCHLISSQLYQTSLSGNQITGRRGVTPTPRPASNGSLIDTPSTLEKGKLLSNKFKFLSNRPFNDFDWKLAKLINRSQKDNWIASTISVKLILGMLYLGLLDKPAKEIEDALSFNNSANDRALKETVIKTFSEILKSLEESKNKEYELNIATQIFYDLRTHLNSTYSSNLKSYFGTDGESVNFKQRELAIKGINEWCYNKTQSKIPELIGKDELSDSTVMILLNAIYFRGEWEKQFPVNHTTLAPFYTSPTTQIKVQMMTIRQKFFYYNITQLKTHLLRLPYIGKKFAMYAFIPYSQNSSIQFSEQINPVLLSESLNNMTERLITLQLPKFQFESSTALVPLLQELGVKELFNPTTNLSNIGWSSEGTLMVSNIIQKSGIEVNEKGSVAYAATDAQIDTRFGEVAIDIQVAHPFFFLIADEQRDAIIFIGKVANPSSDFPSSVSSGEPGDLVNKIKPEEMEELEEEVKKDRYNYFDKELLKELALSQYEKNIVISPASIKSVLALLVEGTGGRTQSELKRALRLPKDPETTNSVLLQQTKALKHKSPTTILNSQNRIYVAEGEKLRASYETIVKTNYYTDVEHLDFHNPEISSRKINAWVNNVTEGMIPELVSRNQIDTSTKLFLINCIYFKADWYDEFDPKNTRQECFYNLKNQCLLINMMTGEKSVNFYYSQDLDAKIVELPFKDPRYTIILMLPSEEIGINNLVKDLIHQDINYMLSGLRRIRVQLAIPRTTIEFSSALSKILQSVDIKDIFRSTANISGILESIKSVVLKDIIHKAKIEINEKGAKAAAITESQVVLLSAPQLNTFKANRPFLFFIRDTSISGFLFEGMVVSPDPASEPKLSIPSTSLYSLIRQPFKVKDTRTSTFKNITINTDNHLIN